MALNKECEIDNKNKIAMIQETISEMIWDSNGMLFKVMKNFI